MKTFILALVLVVCPLANAQLCDTIITYNSEQYIAKIEVIGKKEITFKPCDDPTGPSYTIPKRLIYSMSGSSNKRDTVQRFKREPIKRNIVRGNEKGYFNNTEFGMIHTLKISMDMQYFYPIDSGIPRTGISFLTTHGYSFNKNLKLGLGIGVQKIISRQYYNKNLFDLQIPLFLDFKYIPLKTKASIFIAQKIGVIFIPTDHTAQSFPKDNTGLFLATDIGLWLRIGRRSAFNLGAGYQLSGYNLAYAPTVAYFIHAHFITAKAGFSF